MSAPEPKKPSRAFAILVIAGMVLMTVFIAYLICELVMSALRMMIG